MIWCCRRPNSIPISCYQNLNLDGLLVKMWEMMALVSLALPCNAFAYISLEQRYCSSQHYVLCQPVHMCCNSFCTQVNVLVRGKRLSHQRISMQVRVYTKKVGAKPDFGDPVILSSDRGGTLLEHLCRQIHNSMVSQLNYALVWGTSSKHYPQRCSPAMPCKAMQK